MADEKTKKEYLPNQRQHEMKLTAIRCAVDVHSLAGTKKGIIDIYREIRDTLKED